MIGNIKYFVIVLALIMSITLVSAANPTFGYFKRGEPVELRQECFINGSICDACNITSINFPVNSTRAISNALFEKNSDDFNFTFYNASMDGRYDVKGYCTFGDDVKKPFVAYFTINQAGQPISTAQGIIYVIIMSLSLIILIYLITGTIKIKWKNERGTDGRVVTVNDLKYLKILFGGFSYLMMIWVAFLAMGISQSFLFLTGAYSLFRIIYLILIGGLFPLFILSIVFAVVLFLQDRKIDKMIERGLPVR